MVGGLCRGQGWAVRSGLWLPPPAFVDTGVGGRPEMAGWQPWPPAVCVVWPQLPGLPPAFLDNILGVSDGLRAGGEGSVPQRG